MNPPLNRAMGPMRPQDVTLMGVFNPIRAQLMRAAVYSILAGLLVLAPSVYMLEVYDRVVNSRSHVTLLMLSLMVVVAYAVMEGLEIIRSAMLQEASRELDQSMSPRLFNLVFRANLRRIPVGGIQPMNDWRVVREFVSSPFVNAVMESPVAIVFLVLVFLIHPMLGWVTLGVAVVQVLVAMLTERVTQPPLAQANRAAIQAQSYADSSLRNAELIESMGMLGNIHARWIKLQREFLNLQAQASVPAGGFAALSKMLQQVLSSALLGLAAWLALKNELSGGGGMMIVASIIGGRVLAPLVLMVGQWRVAVNARDSWGRLKQILSLLPEPDPSMPLPRPKGLLTVESLAAAAPSTNGQSSPMILKNIQFALQPGEMLAVIGPSAAGKTTLARLLVGLWPAANGKVRLDGVDIFNWNKDEVGPAIGYLPQGVELFEGTIGQNIARFGDVDRQKVDAAAQLAGLQGLIVSLPQGYDTPVGRDGAVLSGGQRQRVALARALYDDPTLLVLDEPNSSLDEEGDAALLKALVACKARGATIVVMTHRMHVLAAADKVLLVADGVQQAFGPRDDVLAALQKAQAQAQAQAHAAARTAQQQQATERSA